MRAVLVLLFAAAALACTGSDCAKLEISYISVGSPDCDPVVKVGSDVVLSHMGSFQTTHLLVEAGAQTVSVEQVPAGKRATMQCYDISGSYVKNVVGTVQTIDLEAGNSYQCVARVEGRAAVTAREASDRENADVSILVSGSNEIEVGSTEVYTISLLITNAGQNNSDNLVINTQVPEQFTVTRIASVPPVITGGFAVTCTTLPVSGPFDNNVTCTVPRILFINDDTETGFSIIISYTAPREVTNPSQGNELIFYNGTVSADTFDTDLANNIGFNNVTVRVVADLEVTLSGPTQVTAGNLNAYTYSYQVCNNGRSNALGVTVNWTFPSELQFAGPVQINTASPNPIDPTPECTQDATTGKIECFGFNLPTPSDNPNDGLPCQTFSVLVSVASTAQGPTGGDIFINGFAASEVFDRDNGNNNRTYQVEVVVIADIRVTKSGVLSVTAGAPVQTGDRVTVYEMVVSNAGPSQAYGVYMADFVPLVLNIESAGTEQGDCVIDRTRNLVNCSIGDIAANRGSGSGETAVKLNITYTTPASTPPTVFFPSQAPGPNPVINNAQIGSISRDDKEFDNIDPHGIGIVAEADIWVRKTCPPGPIISGTTTDFQYVITLGNRGPSNARDVNVTDQIPSQFIVQNTTPTVTGDVSCRPIVNNLLFCEANSDLTPNGDNAAATITVTVRVRDDILVEQQATNTVTIESSTYQTTPSQADNVFQCSTLIQPPPDMTIRKTGPTSILVDLNETVYFYEISLINNGPTNAVGVRFTDQVPSQFIVAPDNITISGGNAGSSYSYATNCASLSSGNFVDCLFGDLDFGSPNIVVRLAFTVPDTNREQVVENCADVSATLESNLSNNRDCHNITLSNAVDLTVMKSTQPLCAGETGLYTIEVMNVGPATARDVKIVDQFLATLTDVSVVSKPDPVTCTLVANLLNCDLPDMAEGVRHEIVVQYTVPSSFREPQIVNVVNATTSSFENPEDRDNSFTDVNPICISVDVAIQKTGTVTAVAGTSEDAGVPYQYTFEVTNWGPSDARGVRFMDRQFPTGFIATRYESENGMCVFNTDNTAISCTFEDDFTVNPRTIETVTVFYQVLENVVAGIYTNLGEATSDDPDRFLPNNTDTHEVEVITRAPITVVKTGPTDCIVAGMGQGDFQIVVTNEGPSRAYDVELTDVVPTPLEIVEGSLVVVGNTIAGSPTCEIQEGRNIVCDTWGDMGPTQSVTVTYSVRVPASEGANAVGVDNVATASSICSTRNCERVVVVSTWNTKICANADLIVGKTASGGPYIAGLSDRHSFFLEVENQGPSFSYNVVVEDIGFEGGRILSISSPKAPCNMTTLSCTYPALANGERDTITIVFDIPSDRPCGNFPNVAKINSMVTADPDPTNNMAMTSIDVETQHRLRTTKSGPVSIVAGGDSEVYSVRVVNEGPSTATAVVFEDVVPPPLSIVSTSFPPGSQCSVIDRTIVCQLGNMTRGASFGFDYVVSAAANAVTGEVENAACAKSDPALLPPCETEEAICAAVRTNVICRDNLVVTKKDNCSEIVAGAPGQEFTFVMTVSNVGGPSTSRDVKVTDEWPEQYTLIGNPVTDSQFHLCQRNGQLMTCEWQELTVDETITITQKYRVESNVPPQSVTNTLKAVGTCSNSVEVTDSDTNQILNFADLSIIKDDCDDVIVAGATEPNTFTFTIANSGPSDAVNAYVLDTVPFYYEWDGGLEFSGENGVPTCDYTDELDGSRTFKCTYASFAQNSTSKIMLKFKVDTAFPEVLGTNCAKVDSEVDDPNRDNNEDCDTNRILNIADLAVVKELITSAEDDCVIAGNTTASRYIVTVTNHGPSLARQVVLIDNMPVEAIFETGSFPSSCTRSGQSLRCPLPGGSLSSGDSITYTFFFTVASSAPQGTITNFASVASLTTDNDDCNNNFTLVSAVCRYADLTVQKDDSVDFVTAGDGITYKYVIRGQNLGPSDAHNVVLEDIWPNFENQMPGFKLVEVVGASCRFTNEGFLCDLGELAALEYYEFCVLYTVDACTMNCQLCNVVSIASDAVDPVPDNNLDKDCDEVRTEADLEVCKSDNVDSVTAGDGITYTYTMQVSNLGPSCALKVSLVDHFPEVVNQVNGSIITTTGSCVVAADGSGSFTCNMGTFTVGQTETVYVSYTVPADATTCSVVNTVTVSSTTFDPVQCNNDAKDVNAILETAALTVTKTPSAAVLPLTNREPQYFEIVVANAGPSTARDVVITDLWPTTLCQFAERITSTQGRCVSTGGDITCVLHDIAPGAENQVTIKVPFSVCDKSVAGRVDNTVSVFSPTDELCRDATASVTLVNEVRRSKKDVQAQRPKRKALPKVNPVVFRRMADKHAAKKAEPVVRVDASLHPVEVAVEAERHEGKWTVKVTNPTVGSVTLTKLEARFEHDGQRRSLNVFESKDIKSTCSLFKHRKLNSGWSESCTLEMSAKDIQSVTFVVAGAATTSKGMAPVVGRSN